MNFVQDDKENECSQRKYQKIEGGGNKVLFNHKGDYEKEKGKKAKEFSLAHESTREKAIAPPIFI